MKDSTNTSNLATMREAIYNDTDSRRCLWMCNYWYEGEGKGACKRAIFESRTDSFLDGFICK